MFQKILAPFQKKLGSYAKDSLILMTGTAVSMGISLLSSPILSRLYSPEEFGVLTTFTSVYSVLLIAATCRYELAILLPREEEEALSVTLLGAGLSVIFSLALGLVLTVMGLLGAALSYWPFLPPALALLGIYYSCNYWLNRHRRYKILAFNRILQAVLVLAFSLLFVLLPDRSYGMIYAFLIGQGVVAILLIWHMVRDIRTLCLKISFAGMKKEALRYKRFPLFSTPAGLVNTLASQLPTFLLQLLGGDTMVGYYGMMNRVLVLPTQVVGQAMSDVFRQQASAQYAQKGQCLALYRKTAKTLFFVSVIPFALLFFLGEPVFLWFFGENWAVSARLIAIMAPFYLVRFVASPLTFMTIIAEEQLFEMLWQIAYLLASAAGIWLGYLISPAIESLLLGYGVAFCGMYAIHVFCTYRLAKGGRLLGR